MLISLSLKSLRSRRVTVLLTTMSMTLSVALFLSVDKVRRGTRQGFSQTISQTDLIVGARGGSLSLLLYSVFRMGAPTNNLGFDSYRKWAAHPRVEWTIPISLGDGHKGYRVVGTTNAFYKHYRFHGDQQVSWAKGHEPEKLFDVAIGSDVADALGYELGMKLTLSHGVSESGVSFQNHGEHPFQVVGVLAPTGTPIDRGLYVSLAAIEAIHDGWDDGAAPTEAKSPEELEALDLKVGSITAFFVGTKSRFDVLHLQREINESDGEPLMAIIPGVALSDLWQGMSYAEGALLFISGMVVFVGLLGMLVTLYMSLKERRREMAIMRSQGARPSLVFGLLVTEAIYISLLATILGNLLAWLGFVCLGPFVADRFGVYMNTVGFGWSELAYSLVVCCAGALLGVVPAVKAYRNSLSAGLKMYV